MLPEAPEVGLRALLVGGGGDRDDVVLARVERLGDPADRAPLAGGVIAMALRGIPFSVSAAVGFICLSGVAVLNGLVVMSSVGTRLKQGVALGKAITDGMMERVRPVIMTGLVPALGFVPMAIATGTGAEVQRPLATVVIGGLMTSTALVLFVLPAICKLVLPDRAAPQPEIGNAVLNRGLS